MAPCPPPQVFDPIHVLHVALGTCMGTIVLTSASSLRAHLPGPHVGYVYLPAFAALAVGSVLMALVGARLAHRSAAKVLRRIFAGMMAVMVVKFVVGLVSI